MCGFVGFVDFKNDVSSKKNILLNMNSTLAKRGPDEDGYYINKNVALGHKRLIVIDPCLLYTSPSPRDGSLSRMPSSA